MIHMPIWLCFYPLRFNEVSHCLSLESNRMRYECYCQFEFEFELAAELFQFHDIVSGVSANVTDRKGKEGEIMQEAKYEGSSLGLSYPLRFAQA